MNNKYLEHINLKKTLFTINIFSLLFAKIIVFQIIKYFILFLFTINLINFEFLYYINDIRDKENEIYIINKSEKYLKTIMKNKFNNYIRICKKGIFKNNQKISVSRQPKISVIMPIYNGGKYLFYSLRSIQNQKMKDFEIILIDDFSNDNSIKIILKYMEEDPRIRLIKNNKNRKILYSKSISALNSKGKYIIELDQDDMFIRNDCFEILILEAETNNLDLVHIRDFSKKKFFFKFHTKVNMIQDHLIYPQETNYKVQPILKDKIFIDNNVYLLWGLLIKSELYKKAIYRLWPVIMNYQMIFHEDYTISFMLVILAKKYKYINKFGLLHLIHTNSASNSYLQNNQYYLSVLFFANIMNEYYIKNNKKDIFLLLNYINLFINCFQYSKDLYPNLFSHIIKIILNNKYISDESKKKILFKIGINNDKYINNKNNISFDKYKSINQTNLFRKIFNKAINEISIIIYYLEFEYLKKTIISLLKQKSINFEIIIVYDNNQRKDLKYIYDFTKNFQNIKIIVNKNIKGILFSLSKSILASKGKYILFLQTNYILSYDFLLFELYKKIKLNNLDILEFNLIINDNDKLDNNNLRLYKCSHMQSLINVDFLKSHKLNNEIDQEKEILFNKLIKRDFLRNIIKKYNFINYKDVIFNYYDNILLFALFNENAKFKHISNIGIIKTIYNLNEIRMANKKQKIKDTIFYINFLLENTEDTFEAKKFVLDELNNYLSVIFNKFNRISKESIKLLEKFNNNKFINISDKMNLNFYYSSLIN